MNKVSNIAKNTSYFTLALIIQKVISFSYFIILARYLVPADLGKYYFAISFASMFGILMDLGMANVLTREVARRPDKIRQYLGATLALKLPLVLLAVILSLILARPAVHSALTLHLVYIAMLCVVLDSFSLTFFSVIRGLHNLFFESISSVAFQLIVLGLGFFFLKFGWSLVWVMGALAAASIFNLLYSIFLVAVKWRIKIYPLFRLELIKNLIIITIPFSLFAVFNKLYSYLDTVLLNILIGEKAVGLYQIAFKMIFALQFLPLAFVASLYPALSAYWQNNRQQLAITFERAINYLLVISLPISVGIIVLADKIILLFRPEYAEAVGALRLIMAALPFIFLVYPVGSLLNACDRQKTNTLIMGVVLVASVGLNLALIPRWGILGASFVVVLTNCLMLGLGIAAVKRLVKLRRAEMLKKTGGVLIAVATMGLAVWALKPYLNIFVIIPLGALIYFPLLLVFGVVRLADFRSVASSFRVIKV
ncbi:flippase [Candidatus Parcubacteria bacterium]|nr:MAG: flippase [Candidatus Parcubacteria bacterium]